MTTTDFKDIRNDLLFYLKENGFTQNIFTDYAPGLSSYISCFFYDNIPHSFSPTNGKHYVQIQVKESSAEEALNKSRLITSLFFSGIDNDPIKMNGNDYYCQIKRIPSLLDRDKDTVTYYSEIIINT